MNDWPYEVALTANLGALIGIALALWRIAVSVADVKLKVDQMWEWFRRTQIKGFGDGT